MANQFKILVVKLEQIRSDDIIKKLLSDKCKALEEKLSGEVMLIRAPMAPGVDDYVRREIESIATTAGCRDQLVVVLETNGGSIEVVERISEVFRHHFQSVIYVIPNFAYSAGTVLTMSGDQIYMDYYSVLGPIDPQIRNSEGNWVPGLGYLEKYNALVQKSANNTITMAELEFMVRKFDAAELFLLEQAKKQSTDLIEKWLCQYKFKDWTVKKTSGDPVTKEFKADRAKSIAEMLGDATHWNSHGRGIPMRILESDDLKLKINDFGSDPELSKAVRGYYDLFIDYCTKTGAQSAIHTKGRLFNLGG